MFDSHGNLYVVGANTLIQCLKYNSSTKGFVASKESTQFIKEVTEEGKKFYGFNNWFQVNDAKTYKELMDNISLRQLRKKSDENPNQNKKRKVDDDS